MNILIISQNYYPEIGSHANRITDLSILLDQKGYKIDVLTSEPSYPNKDLYNIHDYWDERKNEVEKNNVNVIRLKSRNKSRGQGKIRRLFYYFNFLFQTLWYVISTFKSYDFVLVTSPQLFIGITGILAKFKFGAKFIFDIRDLWPESVKHVGIYKKNDIALNMAYGLEKIILKTSDAIIINSKGFINYLKKKNVEEKCYYLPNAIREEELSINMEYRKKVLGNKNFTIVYAGNIGLAQDLRVLVKLANELKDYKNISFIVIGTGVQEKKIKEQSQNYKLQNIAFKGALPRKETLKEIAKYDLAFINLKEEDVFKTVIPGKLLDYMSLGIPILAGVEGEARTIIYESRCGFVCNPGDYKSMAKIVLGVLDKQSELLEIGLRGHEYIKKHFIWEKNIECFEKITIELKNSKYKHIDTSNPKANLSIGDLGEKDG